ncbi:MAG: ornithine carbamoyltransferase [Pelagibacteraceae bacterium]|jgi:ornithine carbamoyltransferase|nr:ornithine carbamoyltransferase [Pelagibacteraceae bacterium]MDP6783957.1 ornithine carbamoyltransferase [Alphaproteobacteria bacterium]MBO6467077.1 ornithine carbamoyltransferase [Pelagibacteraceae bacterium]MBO6467244.1 ornithine carbamoyltransferase [Pelagibacteraceae bacterium]MBO6470014.1 ornithine carbamoyltransferase [Pelagibacteraceae bacterium]
MINHFVDISDFKKSELKRIISFAKRIKNNPNKYENLLQNKSLGMIFEKQSNRTRLSFDIGMKKIGGNVIELDKKGIGFGKRESDSDMINVLSQYIDCLIIRNNDHSKIKELSRLNLLPIINGLSNFSHPCQILSDIFTIEEILGSIDKQKITWVGDINNVLISLLQASHIFRFRLKIASPKALLLKNRSLINKFKSKNISFCSDPIEAVKGTDCVMTDVWVSMGEKKSVKKKKIFKNFQVNENLMRHTHKKTIFMHCLPAHRNEEVVDSVIDSKKSVVWQQAQNRMYVQQSILNYCIL